MIEQQEVEPRNDEIWQVNEERSMGDRRCREQTSALIHFVTGIGMQPQEAKEVIQIVWLRFLQRRTPFEGVEASEQCRRWLCKVAQNEAMNVFRCRSRHPSRSLDALPDEPIDRREERAAIQENDERERSLLHTWMEELREREPINYRLLQGQVFEDRSIKELAAAEGLSANAVSCRLHHTIGKLRARAKGLRDDESTSR